jgi:hypothetical protein
MEAPLDLLDKLSEQTHAWILSERTHHFPHSRGLTEEERKPLEAYFLPETLRQARVRVVDRIDGPPFYDAAVQELARLGIATNFQMTGAAGITFVDCILVRKGAESPALLFHEMVHVVQYGMLGSAKFAKFYVQGLARVGFVYERNPFESVAHEIEGRFRAGQKFQVLPAVADWCRQLGYN